MNICITVSEIRPFRDGHSVLALRSRYDPELVRLLKDAIRWAGSATGVKNAGGWLPDYRVWFVERAAWHLVRQRLVSAGCQIVNEESPVPAPQNTPQKMPDLSAMPPIAGSPGMLGLGDANAMDRRRSSRYRSWA